MKSILSASPPPLDYARAPRLPRRLRPGSPGFCLLVTILTIACAWGAWQWRLKADETAFKQHTTPGMSGSAFIFVRPPDAASLRHVSRLSGISHLGFFWSDPPEPSGPAVLRGRNMNNIKRIGVGKLVDADGWVKEMSRPGTGLRSLQSLILGRTPLTDQGLKDLSRPNSALTRLATLILSSTSITDDGAKTLARADAPFKSLNWLDLSFTKITDDTLIQLARPDSGLTALTCLELTYTQITDSGLKELARPDAGLKSLKELQIRGTKVTEEAIKALKKARPELEIQH
jgi:hypothetical protein